MDLRASEPKAAREAQLGYRRRTILLFGRIAIVACVVFCALNALEGRVGIAVVDAVGAVVFALNGALLARARISADLAAVVFSAAGLTITTAASYSLGGGPQNFVWLGVPAIAATFLAGRRLGLLFLALGFVPMAIFSWMRATGAKLPPDPSVAFDFALLAGACAILWAFAASYDRQKDASLEALDELRRRAEEANRAKSLFLAHMSHEIRTPMNGMFAMTELLGGTRLDAEQSSLVRVLRDSNAALLRVIDDILDLSKVEAGKVAVARADFSLAPLVEGVRMMFAATKPKVRVTAALDADVPPIIHGDAGRIRQVLANFVGNAVKFTDTGEVKIAVSGRGSGRLRFEVSDTGVGIEKDQLGLLFQPFTQLDASTTRRHDGTGLGLAISRGLVEAMGGQIGADSERGRGSRFWFEIDAPAGAHAEVAAPASVERAERRARVLVAEDNAVNQYVTRALLERLGHACVVVANGKEAVAALERDEFDLVLMDCQMPELDGFAATRAIRAMSGARAQTPVVALTASALGDEHEECYASGMNEVLTKPITAGALAETIARLVSPKAALTPS